MISALSEDLDRPNLVYDFYYWSLIHSLMDTRYLLKNSLNLSHRFNQFFRVRKIGGKTAGILTQDIRKCI